MSLVQAEGQKPRSRVGRRAVAALVALGVVAAAIAIVIVAVDGDSASAEKIPQPDVGDLEVAPESQRVDFQVPSFSDPTEVTNPLFPISRQESVLLLGRVDGEPFRTEVTLLPETRIIEWEGQRVEVLVSQYVAYLSGRLHEVAYDFYAQDDNGAVWYFGEDVFNFSDGKIADTHGTWIAGKDGPAAMIMPADPKVGDVYRPENIPGLVFEEVTVKRVGETLPGPLGPVAGGITIEEVHMDGVTETKTFGPGYGEFLTGGSGDVEAISLAVPTDRLEGPVAAELTTLEAGAVEIYGHPKVAGSARAKVTEMNAAWEAYKPTGNVPSNMEPRMTASLASLTKAVGGGDVAKVRQAAIDVAQWALDLQLRYRPATEVDLARLDYWLAQIQLDAQAGDPALVNGDFFAIDYVRDRIQQTLGEADRAQINFLLEDLNGAVADEEFGVVSDLAQQLRERLGSRESA